MPTTEKEKSYSCFNFLCVCINRHPEVLNSHIATPWHNKLTQYQSLCAKATIHQVTTMLATSKNVLFPGHNHLLTTGTDDPTL